MNNVVYQLQDRWLASQAREATSRRVAAALADLAVALARAERTLDGLEQEASTGPGRPRVVLLHPRALR